MKLLASYKRRRNNNKRRKNNNKERSQAEISIMIKGKKKKMINRGSSNKADADANANANANDDISSDNALDDDFVVYEILGRLPVKTLMRFKSVCKRWRSSIQHDPQFHQLHFKHSKTRRLGLYIVTDILGYESSVVGHREFILSAPDLIKGARADSAAATLHTIREMQELSCYDEVLDPVNGLVCWADVLGDAVCIYNPSTREETPWIKRTTTSAADGRKYRWNLPRFVFGYDPATKEHKVIRNQAIFVNTQTRQYEYTACEVLTVGDSSWRRIDDQVPPCDLEEPSIYVNGAIYWVNKNFHKHDEMWYNGAPEFLVAFDVGSEKFRRPIPIPDFIIDQPRDESYWDQHEGQGQSIDLLEVDGRVALLRRRNKNTVSMWILFEDGADHNRHWTEVIIILPFDWVGKNTYVYFHNTPGMTDQIIVTASGDDMALTAYSYNWKKNAFSKVEISGICAPAIHSYSLVTPFAESLFPVITSISNSMQPP